MTRNQFSSSTLAERFGANAKFIDILRDLEIDAQQIGEVICGIELNGRKINETEELFFHKLPVDEIQSLAIVTGRPLQLAQGIVANWVKTLPDLVGTAEEIAESLKFDADEVSLQQFANLLDACQYLVESLMLLRAHFEREGDFKEIEANWSESEENLTKVVRQSIEAMENKDFVLLSELVEYDLCGSLEAWVEVLTECQSRYFQAESNAQNIGHRSDNNF